MKKFVCMRIFCLDFYAPESGYIKILSGLHGVGCVNG